jgi:hypothetical protein
MVKSFIAALWIIAMTLAGLYGPSLLRTHGGHKSEAPGTAPEPFKTDHIAVAVFRDGKVSGYFTSRLNCDLTDQSFKDSVLARLTHELYKAVYANTKIDFHKPQPEALTALAEEIAKGLNGRAGRPVIENLKIEEPDFLRRL